MRALYLINLLRHHAKNDASIMRLTVMCYAPLTTEVKQ